MNDNKLLKHLKRAVSKFESRPILRCVHYDANGSIAATDSHRLLLIENFHNHNKEINQDIRTMEILDAPYPELGHLIPNKAKSKIKITISLSVLLRAAKALNTNTDEIIVMKIEQGKITFTNLHDEKIYGSPVKIEVNAQVVGESMKLGVNSRYIIDACEFLLDAKERYAVDDTVIHLYSENKPFTLEIKEGKYLYLVTPVRLNLPDGGK